MARGGSAILKSEAVSSWALDPVAIDKWLKSAAVGDRLIYAHGWTIVNDATGARLRQLQADGQVSLHHDRSDLDGAKDYLAIRRRVSVVSAPRAPKVAHDPTMAAVLAKLKEAARKGLRCPSDRALGDMLGITADQVKWAMRKLVRDGRIHSEVRPVPGEARYRVVTIAADGLSTAEPETGR